MNIGHAWSIHGHIKYVLLFPDHVCNKWKTKIIGVAQIFCNAYQCLPANTLNFFINVEAQLCTITISFFYAIGNISNYLVMLTRAHLSRTLASRAADHINIIVLLTLWGIRCYEYIHFVKLCINLEDRQRNIVLLLLCHYCTY